MSNRRVLMKKLSAAKRTEAVVKTLSVETLRQAYAKGMTLTRYLETLDPTAGHSDKSTDAFERALRKCGIRTRSVPELGIPASTLEDVVKHPRAQHLAIELFARAYRGAVFGGGQRSPTMTSLDNAAGSFFSQFAYPDMPRGVLLEPSVPLSEVVAINTGIKPKIFKPFYLLDVDKVTSRVAEAAEIPAVTVAQTENIIHLKKYGRRIDVTYESLREIPIDLLGFYIRRIAVKIEAEKVDRVTGIIINGDGNSGTAATSYNVSDLNGAAAGTTFNYEAWLAFKMKFRNPFMLTTALGTEATALALMLLDTGTPNIPLALAGRLFQGASPEIINQNLRTGERVGWLPSAVPANKIVGFDARMAIQRVFQIGADLQESDKDVKKQINSLVLSEVEGYAVLEQQGNKVLNLAA